MFKMTMSTKGQFTLPSEIRRRLKLHVGSTVQGTVDEQGRVILVPAQLTVDELLAQRPKWPRGARPVPLEDLEAGIGRGAARGRF